MPRAATLYVLLLASACFAEPGPATSGGGSTTSDPTCTPGTLGCVCGESSACTEGLVCEPSVQVCIEADCTPGTELCTCNAGACITGFECTDGLCRAPTTPTDTTGAMSGSGSESGTPMTTGTTIEPPDTSGTITASGEVDVDDSAGDPCEACRACTETAVAGPCVAQYQTCTTNDECGMQVGMTTLCCDQACVAGVCVMSGARPADYDALATCLDDECAPFCRFSFAC